MQGWRGFGVPHPDGGAPLVASAKTLTGSGPEPRFKGIGSFSWPG